MSYYDAIDAATARFEEFARRDDGVELGKWVRKGAPKGTAARARRIATALMAVVGLVIATIAFGLIVGPIGIGGLFFVTIAMLALLLAISLWPAPRPRPVQPFRDEMSNTQIVQRLGTVLSRGRSVLPAAAAQRADAIAQSLPLLESRLAERNALDPLAQDARRLLGQHLPELIQRYERVPAQYRGERDGQGMSVDQRLVVGLDAARAAIDDLTRKLSEQDVAAFEVQGRFIESRYADEGPGVGALPAPGAQPVTLPPPSLTPPEADLSSLPDRERDRG